jgi:hypothetical protein
MTKSKPLKAKIRLHQAIMKIKTMVKAIRVMAKKE